MLENAEKHWSATPEMLKLLSTRAYITVFFIIYYDCGNVVIITSLWCAAGLVVFYPLIWQAKYATHTVHSHCGPVVYMLCMDILLHIMPSGIVLPVTWSALLSLLLLSVACYISSQLTMIQHICAYINIVHIPYTLWHMYCFWCKWYYTTYAVICC